MQGAGRGRGACCRWMECADCSATRLRVNPCLLPRLCGCHKLLPASQTCSGACSDRLTRDLYSHCHAAAAAADCSRPPLPLVFLGSGAGGRRAVCWALPRSALLQVKVSQSHVTRHTSHVTRHTSHLLRNHTRDALCLFPLTPVSVPASVQQRLMRRRWRWWWRWWRWWWWWCWWWWRWWRWWRWW